MTDKKHKHWFDQDLAKLLSSKLVNVYPDFESQGFIQDIQHGVDELELKARLKFFADRLKYYLPDDYPKAIKILVSILGAENPSETGMFTEFYWVMPISTYVEHYGLEHFDDSIKAIAEITKRNTGEFAIRPYLKTYPEQTLKKMEQWSLDSNFHLRRLASEGARPRLPWAAKLDLFIEDPRPALPILENLKDDPIRFVQKSVGNHINDILKDNYDFGMNIIQNWVKNPTKQRRWIVKHALRKQAKDGNQKAIRIKEAL